MFSPATQPLERGLYHYILELETRRAVRYAHFFSLCHISLDQDYDGDHTILSTVTDILRETIRETDIIGLVNERTLSVLLHNAEIQNAYVVAERIRTRIADQNFISGDTYHRGTGSIGCVCFPTHGNDATALLLRAGELLAAAQRQGGNASSIPDKSP
jgi:diguanylate cyclase (GGDEF)-like protein